MRKLRNTWFPCLSALMLPAACAPARVATKASERLLLKRSTKVYTLPTHGCNTYWAGTNTLLLVTNAKRNLEIPSEWKGRAERLDTRTGQRLPDRRLTAMLNSLHMEPGDCTPSPDGKWLLWDMSGTLDHSWVPFLSTASGQRQQLYLRQGGRPRTHHWIDNQHWVCEENDPDDPRLYVHSTQDSAVQNFPAYSAQAQAALSTKFLRDGLQYSAVYDEDKYKWPNPLTIVQCDRVHPKFPGSRNNVPYTNKYVVALPKQMSIEDVQIAANTNRMLYQVEYTNRQSQPTRQQISANLRHKGTTFAGLWTSGVDGSELHEIGHVALKDGDSYMIGPFWRLQWLPDGRHISFIFKDTVYKIAAD